MSLDWNLGKIDNFKEKCYNDDSLNPMTEALIFSTMIVGLNEISEKNVDEFYFRIALFESLFTTMLKTWENDEPVSVFIERDDIVNHIGLWTNASSMTNAQYRKHVLNEFEVSLQRG